MGRDSRVGAGAVVAWRPETQGPVRTLQDYRPTLDGELSDWLGSPSIRGRPVSYNFARDELRRQDRNRDVPAGGTRPARGGGPPRGPNQARDGRGARRAAPLGAACAHRSAFADVARPHGRVPGARARSLTRRGD